MVSFGVTLVWRAGSGSDSTQSLGQRGGNGGGQEAEGGAGNPAGTYL